MANPNSGTCSAFRQRWSAFQRSLDIKIRIVMYRVAPFFTLREYCLSPWYENSRRKSKEASWMMAWQQMNQQKALQGTKTISSLHTLSSFLPIHTDILVLPCLCPLGCFVVQDQQERNQQPDDEAVKSTVTSLKISIDPTGLDDDENDNEETMQYSPHIEYSSIYSMFGSLLGLSSVFVNNSPKATTATTVRYVVKSKSNQDLRYIDADGSSPAVNEEIRFDATNPLLRVRSQQGLTRWA